MRLLLISNSTNPGEAYLEYPKSTIQAFLEYNSVKKILFVPFAAVNFSYDTYEEKVQNRFNDFNIEVESIHRLSDPTMAITEAQAIVVGGGNTFKLLKSLQDLSLLPLIREQVLHGTPFVGWSAGANLACPTICTTNDMPIVMPHNFDALNLVPFQINPHYLDVHPDNHGGETREQRIEEYLAVMQNRYVVGLRESSILQINNNKMQLIGTKTIRVFRYGYEPKELSPNCNIDFLLK